MTKKLLYKTSKSYLIFSVSILIVAAPLFYFITQKLYFEETNDTLLLHKKEFFQYTLPSLKITDIETWNKFNRNIKILATEKNGSDTIFEAKYFDTLDNEIEPYLELHTPVFIEGKPFAYIAKINLVETKDLIRNVVLLFLIVAIILLIGLYFTTKIVSEKLWKPFNDTLLQIENFEIDKNKQPLFLETDIEEFYRLNKSIEKLIEKNSIIYKSQREFIDNAAHELQTPLAVFQAKIDTLIQLPNLTEKHNEILSSLNESISKLNHLNKNLLLLSKIENNSYFNKEKIMANDVIQKNLFFFEEQAASKNIIIKTDLKNELVVDSNAALLEILINNLMLNAIRHNVLNGEIFVVISEKKITISNSGQPKSLTNNNLFVRFSKSTTEEQGNGLGLAIVKKIADLNQWKIEYCFKNNLHIFQVSF